MRIVTLLVMCYFSMCAIAEDRIKHFNSETEKQFKVNSGSHYLIDVERDINLDVEVDISKAIISFSDQNNKSFAYQYLKDIHYDTLDDFEFICAKSYVSEFNETNYFLLFIYYEWSRPGKLDRSKGNCGAGIEGTMAYVILDKNGELKRNHKFLIESCWMQIDMLNISNIGDTGIIKLLIASFHDKQYTFLLDSKLPDRPIIKITSGFESEQFVDAIEANYSDWLIKDNF